MKKLLTPDGDEIVGIYEAVQCRTNVQGFYIDQDTGHLEPEYAGDSEMWWDDSWPVVDCNGQYTRTKVNALPAEMIYLDEHNNSYRLDELTVVDAD